MRHISPPQDFHDRQLSVRIDRAGFETADGTILFMGNLPWAATDETIFSLLAAYAPFDVNVKTTASGRSRGFALLRFPDAEKATAVVAAFHKTEMEGRALEVREDRPAEKRSEGNGGRKKKHASKGACRGVPGSGESTGNTGRSGNTGSAGGFATPAGRTPASGVGRADAERGAARCATVGPRCYLR